ncbi:MAG: ferritin-like domain-containing protein [Thermoanaerobaculia bacterium]
MERRGLAWTLSFYRQSELDGALLLGRVARAAADGELLHTLVRHCAEEARHAWLWSEALRELGLAPVRIHRSYQSLYAEKGLLPRSLLEVLALTHVFERRVDRWFRDEWGKSGTPEPVRRTIQVLLRDEEDHLAWVGRWLAGREEEAGRLLAAYTAVDDEVYRELAPFVDCLWKIPGLGEELPGRTEKEEVPHAARREEGQS